MYGVRGGRSNKSGDYRKILQNDDTKKLDKAGLIQSHISLSILVAESGKKDLELRSL